MSDANDTASNIAHAFAGIDMAYSHAVNKYLGIPVGTSSFGAVGSAISMGAAYDTWNNSSKTPEDFERLAVSLGTSIPRIGILVKPMDAFSNTFLTKEKMKTGSWIT